MRFTVIVGMAFLLSLGLLAGLASAETQRVRLDVSGLSCVTDMLAVRAIMEGMQGVSEFNISTDSSSVTLSFDDSATSLDEIAKALGEGEYPVDKVSPID